MRSVSTPQEGNLHAVADGTVPPNPAGVVPATKALCANVNELLTSAGLVNVDLRWSIVRARPGT